MRRRTFFYFAAILGWFAHDGARAQTIHMAPALTGFTDSAGIVWTPNTCTGWITFNNPGTFPSPIYNSPAYTLTAGVPILCPFRLTPGQYRILIHLIEGVKSFNGAKKRVFSIFANGDPVLTNVDVFQRAGGVEIPYDVSTVAVTDPTGNLTISFTQVKSSAMFAGIEIFPLAGSITLLNSDGSSIGPISAIRMGGGMTWQVSGSNATLDVDTAQIPTRVQLQSGIGNEQTGSGNPQVCQSVTTDGLLYTAACSSMVNQLVPLQILNINIPVANTGPVMLSVDTLPAQPLIDRSGAPLSAGNLTPGLTPVWNDGANWRLLFPSPAPAPVAKIWTCNGSGPGWDCGSLKLVQIPQTDGSLLSIAGTLSTIPIDSKWTLQ